MFTFLLIPNTSQSGPMFTFQFGTITPSTLWWFALSSHSHKMNCRWNSFQIYQSFRKFPAMASLAASRLDCSASVHTGSSNMTSSEKGVSFRSTGFSAKVRVSRDGKDLKLSLWVDYGGTRMHKNFPQPMLKCFTVSSRPSCPTTSSRLMQLLVSVLRLKKSVSTSESI